MRENAVQAPPKTETESIQLSQKRRWAVQPAEIQPGVISTFRSFTLLRAILLGLTLLIQVVLRGWNSNALHFLFIVSFLDAAFLSAYLSTRRFEKLFGAAYLPIGILWASAGPILEPHLADVLVLRSFSENAMILTAWQLIPILFIPLVIVAWQYSFRVVAVFCAVTAVMDLLPIVIATVFFNVVFLPFPAAGVIFIRTVSFLFVGNMITKLVKAQRDQQNALADANARLAQYASTLEELTVSRERNRLARELHDVLAHTLSEVAVELEAVKALWDLDPERAQSMLNHSLHSTRDGLTETRRALQELRASPLQDLGLGLAVRALAESITIRSGLRLESLIDEKLEDFPPDVQQSIYRVAQESLANIVQHSGARCVRVLLVNETGRLKLSISDDGRGFDVREVDNERQYGLRGMRERIAMIGGQFMVESQPGIGTTISVTYGGGANGAG